MHTALLIALAAAGVAHAADPLAPRPNGPMPAPPGLHLIDNATVHAAPGAEPAVLDVLIRDGRIERVAPEIEHGPARVWDAAGMHLYAGFIDAFVPVEAPAADTDAPGSHWSGLVGPQRDALAGAGLPASDAEALRKLGFAAAHVVPADGIFRGWGAVVSTAEAYADPALGRPPVHKARASQHLGFEKAGWSSGGYPTSHMGIVALMRQTFIDAAHRSGSDHADRSALDAIDPAGLMLYDTAFELEALLADKVAREFGHERVAIVGSGSEFKRLDALAEAGRPVIVPLVQPETPDVWSVGAADAVTLEELMAWEQAPANPRWLDDKGLAVSITASKLPRGQDFHANLARSIDAGLSPDRALAMLTTNPAELLGVADTLGTIEPGKRANLVLASAPLFHHSDAKGDDKAAVLAVWIDGRRHEVNEAKDTRFDGEWGLVHIGSHIGVMLTIRGETMKFHDNGEELEEVKARKIKIQRDRISFVLDATTGDDRDGSYLFSGVIGPDGVIRGTTIGANQDIGEWRATRLEANAAAPAGDDGEKEAEPALVHDAASDDRPEQTDDKVGRGRRESEPSKRRDPPAMPVGVPFGAYTVGAYPDANTYLLVNATVWTQADQGILENAWVLVEGDIIAGVGTGDRPRTDVEVIDLDGKHVTPGLIDAHSHTGLFRLGVNESGQAVTSEVRIADALDTGHVNFYRQLAGGVTTALLLHGSANPIGGQSQTVKIRWGALRAEDMHFEGSTPGIKFALGENVKQSNWGDDATTRYPQTRLGVETLMRDRFTKAREYRDRWDRVKRAMRDAQPQRTSPFGNEQTRWFASFQDDSRALDRFSVPLLDDVQTGYLDEVFRSHGLERFEIPPIDMELEILAEILAGERLVHCHSYRQDEILMLCRVAEDFGFKIGTFQHGLETYKVAEVVREHAIGASIFSDWWAYKVEVQDAIPAAGPINFEAGLRTSFNSDSDELARRMNAEAGKAYKYARDAGIEMTPQDALDFVTRNPAIQLGIIDRVGTIEPGKDADLAVWSGDPLSSMSRCERTFVDGRQLFSPEIEAAHRERMRAERTRLIGLIMAEGRPPFRQPGARPDPDAAPVAPEADEDEPPTRRALLARAYERALSEHVDHGPRPGDCGCSLLPRELIRTAD